jgi:hypothetical protein
MRIDRARAAHVYVPMLVRMLGPVRVRVRVLACVLVSVLMRVAVNDDPRVAPQQSDGTDNDQERARENLARSLPGLGNEEPASGGCETESAERRRMAETELEAGARRLTAPRLVDDERRESGAVIGP